MVVMDKAEHARPFGDALVGGGLPVAEITFRTPAAEAAIRELANRGDLLVGAGTILTTEQADRAIDAGAQFLVAPGTNPKVVEHVLKRGVHDGARRRHAERNRAGDVARRLDAEILSRPKRWAAWRRSRRSPGRTRMCDSFRRAASRRSCCRTICELRVGRGLRRFVAAPRDLLAAGKFDAIARLVEQARKSCSPVRRQSAT